MFGVEAAPCLRTLQLWIGAIKDGSFNIQKKCEFGTSSINPGTRNDKHGGTFSSEMPKDIVAWIVDPFIEFSQRICI